MGYINTDQCDCCKEIWNRVNLHYIPLQSVTLIICDDCLSEFKNCFIDKHKIDEAIGKLTKEIEENHLNVIDYADGEWIVKDFVYGAIDRFKEKIALDK